MQRLHELPYDVTLAGLYCRRDAWRGLRVDEVQSHIKPVNGVCSSLFFSVIAFFKHTPSESDLQNVSQLFCAIWSSLVYFPSIIPIQWPKLWRRK